MNVPKLRFKEFNDDWIEEKINELVELNPKNPNLPENFIYIDLESVSNGILLQEKILTKDDAPSRAQRQVKVNDILYQTVRPYQKNNLFIDKLSHLPYIASTGYAILREKNIYQKFLFNKLHTDSFVNEVLDNCTGTSYPAINSNDLGNIKIFCPNNFKEQKRIGDFLSLIDKKIELQTKKIEDLKLFKLYIKNKIFSGIKTKDKIINTLNYEQPNRYIVKSDDYLNDENLIPVLTANKAFILGYCNEDDYYNKGDVIIFDDFTMDSKYVNFNFKIKSSAIKLLTQKNNNNLKYIFECLQALNLESTEHKRHYISIVQEIEIPVPDIIVQNKIANLMFTYDKKIKLESDNYNKLIELKKGLMQNMFV